MADGNRGQDESAMAHGPLWLALSEAPWQAAGGEAPLCHLPQGPSGPLFPGESPTASLNKLSQKQE